MIDQERLNFYFKNIWHGHITSYRFSGPALIKKVFSLEHVLDVGCGENYFKGKIRNLTGIDPANDAADVQVCIETFNTDKLFDVAFCLGSVNFGEQEDIERQLAALCRLLKPNARIYWRCNPGLHDHGNKECNALPIFRWSIEKHFDLSKKFGFTLNEFDFDSGDRLYAVWVREDRE